MAQRGRDRNRSPGDATLARAVLYLWSPAALGGHRAMCAPRTGQTWRQALRLWTVDSILRQRRMAWRCAACRRTYRRGGCLNSTCQVIAKERVPLKMSFLCQRASCGGKSRLLHDIVVNVCSSCFLFSLEDLYW